jgi:hypothetical protein
MKHATVHIAAPRTGAMAAAPERAQPSTSAALSGWSAARRLIGGASLAKA